MRGPGGWRGRDCQFRIEAVHYATNSKLSIVGSPPLRDGVDRKYSPRPLRNPRGLGLQEATRLFPGGEFS
jgi:hypothetical protein